METINRRAMMRGLLCIAAAGAGAALSSSSADAMPIDTGLANAPDGLIEQAQWGRPPPRHWHGPRRRRWVCWWHRGRRVCGWR
jgi:hypothetical protein